MKLKPICGENGGVTKAGAPCSVAMNLSPTNGLCVMHDPERATDAAAMRAAGQRANGAANRRAKAADPDTVPPAPKTLEDAVFLAAWITRAVLIGDIDVRVAEAATKAVRQFQLGEEKRAMEAEIKHLRAELAAAQKGVARPVLGVTRGGSR